MSNDMPSVTGIGSVIPFFFFDAIGRIVPGSYLLAFAFWFGWVSPWVENYKWLFASGTGLVIVAVCFVTTAYFLGFVLGALSFNLIEMVWRNFSPWVLQDIIEESGNSSDSLSDVEISIKKILHFKLRVADKAEQSQRIIQCSELCHFYVWSRNAQLGLMASRWDAEALSSGSTLFATIILFLSSMCCGFLRLSFVFVGLGLGTILQYKHCRKRRVVGKFNMFRAFDPSEVKKQENIGSEAAATV